MFLPFLFAFIAVVLLNYDKPRLGILFWLATLITIIILLHHHATDALHLSF